MVMGRRVEAGVESVMYIIEGLGALYESIMIPKLIQARDRALVDDTSRGNPSSESSVNARCIQT
jgi:hypothetical protein